MSHRLCLLSLMTGFIRHYNAGKLQQNYALQNYLATYFHKYSNIIIARLNCKCEAKRTMGSNLG